MRRNELLKKITGNWLAKITCLIIAVLLYWSYHGTLTQSKNLALPLELLCDRDLLPVNVVDKNVRITVKASPESVEELTAADFRAYIDANVYDEAGTHPTPVKLELSQRARQIEPLEITVKPNSVALELEKRASRIIPVDPVFIGEPAEGYEVTGFSIQPQEVLVSGPESAVNSCPEMIQIALQLGGKTEAFSQTTEAAKEIDNKLVSIDGIASVLCTVNILPKQGTRFYPSVEVSYNSLNPYFEIKQKATLGMTVWGVLNTINRYTPAKTVLSVDCSGIESAGEYSLPVAVRLPDGITLFSLSSENITVTVDVAPVVLPPETEEEN